MDVTIVEPASKPDFNVYRFRVHKIVKMHFYAKDNHSFNYNFGVYGDKNEFMEICFYLDDKQMIESVRTYHFTPFDNEQSGYVVLAVIKWFCRIKKVQFIRQLK